MTRPYSRKSSIRWPDAQVGTGFKWQNGPADERAKSQGGRSQDRRHFQRRAAIAFAAVAAVLPRIDDANHPVGARMDMHISGLNGLLLTAPVLVQCLDEVDLETH
jgi:hypothetical protein